jgi:hypothetical protein
MIISSQSEEQIANVVEEMSVLQSNDIGCAIIHIGNHPVLGKIVAISSYEKSALVSDI